MSDPFIGEIKLVAWTNRIPTGWALCNGAQLSIQQNAALFALIGVTYGGDGHTYFNLPNLQGRVVLADGPSTVRAFTYQAGQKGGAESATGAGTVSVPIQTANLPGHTHPATFTPTGGSVTPAQVNVTATLATLQTAAGNMLGQTPTAGPTAANIYAPAASPVSGQLAGVSGGSGGITGGTVAVQSNNPGTPTPAVGTVSVPVATMPPYLVLHYIIATQGLFPDNQ
jgi:microcystin-dependent protein